MGLKPDLVFGVGMHKVGLGLAYEKLKPGIPVQDYHGLGLNLAKFITNLRSVGCGADESMKLGITVWDR